MPSGISVTVISIMRAVPRTIITRSHLVLLPALGQHALPSRHDQSTGSAGAGCLGSPAVVIGRSPLLA